MQHQLIGLATAGIMLAAAQVAQAYSRLTTVQDRGSLLCSGHNGSFLGFAEVDDKGIWKGVDIDLCRALAAGIFDGSKGNLVNVPISWAQRWPALQSGDIDVVIKVSGWTQSRDTELNLVYSRPYFIGAFQTMTHASLGAESMADLDGGSLCVGAERGGTGLRSEQRADFQPHPPAAGHPHRDAHHDQPERPDVGTDRPVEGGLSTDQLFHGLGSEPHQRRDQTQGHTAEDLTHGASHRSL